MSSDIACKVGASVGNADAKRLAARSSASLAALSSAVEYADVVAIAGGELERCPSAALGQSQSLHSRKKSS